MECIQTGDEPLCTLEDGHSSTSFAHLANISLAMNTRLEWDPVTERITNNEKANELIALPIPRTMDTINRRDFVKTLVCRSRSGCAPAL